MQAVMKYIWKWLRHYVSPAFLVLLLASFILWFISKLSSSYVIEETVHLLVEDRPVEVRCVIEGPGSSLFMHRIQSRTLHIPLEELHYRTLRDPEHAGLLRLDPQTVQQAIAVRMSDVKILSVGAVPEIEAPAKP